MVWSASLLVWNKSGVEMEMGARNPPCSKKQRGRRWPFQRAGPVALVFHDDRHERRQSGWACFQHIAGKRARAKFDARATVERRGRNIRGAASTSGASRRAREHFGGNGNFTGCSDERNHSGQIPRDQSFKSGEVENLRTVSSSLRLWCGGFPRTPPKRWPLIKTRQPAENRSRLSCF